MSSEKKTPRSTRAGYKDAECSADAVDADNSTPQRPLFDEHGAAIGKDNQQILYICQKYLAMAAIIKYNYSNHR